MRRKLLSIMFVGILSFLAGVASVAGALEISQTHPLFVFPAPGSVTGTAEASGESIQHAWNSLPEFYQAHAVMAIPHLDVDMAVRSKWTVSVLRHLKDGGIPLSVGVANGGRKQYFLPETIESLLKTYPSIQALEVDDFRFDVPREYGDLSSLGMNPQLEWLKYVVTLAVKYDKKIIIRLTDLNPILMTSNPAYRSLYDVLAANRKDVILVYPQGGPHTILGNTSLMGLWLEGAVDQWGVAVDSRAYSRAGFVEPGVFGEVSDSHTASAQSASVYRGWLLSGAMMGATAYVFDNADELWAGMHTRFWGQAIAPTLLELVQKGYIARQDLVKRNAVVAYRVKPATTWSEFEENLVDLDGVFHEGRMMEAVYGFELPGQIPEWVPNQGRYYYIPILSPYASEDVLFSFKEVMMPGAVLDAAGWPERLNGYYTADGEGTAFIKKVGRAIFVFHSQENLEEVQTYTLSAVPAPLHDISAIRNGSSITVTWPFREGDVSYTVYRVVNPNLDMMQTASFLEIARGVESRKFVDEGIAPGETVVYSVTALTNEQTTLSGTLHYGEYAIFSSVESRRDGFALVEPYTMRSRTVNGIPETVVPMQESRPWWSMPESDQEHVTKAGEAIALALVELSNRYQEEDVEALMGLFTDDFTDSVGTSKPMLRELFESVFEDTVAGPLHRQVRSWDLNDFEFSGEILVTAFIQFTAVEENDDLVPHPVRSFPQSGTGEIEITFYEQHDGTWKIKKTEPPLLRIRDVIGH